MSRIIPKSGEFRFEPDAKSVGLCTYIENGSDYNVFVKRYGGMTQVIPKAKIQKPKTDNYIRIYGTIKTFLGKCLFLDVNQATTPLDAYLMTHLLEVLNESPYSQFNRSSDHEIELKFDFTINTDNWGDVEGDWSHICSHILGISLLVSKEEKEEYLRSAAVGTAEYEFKNMCEPTEKLEKGIISHRIKIVDNKGEYTTMHFSVAGDVSSVTPIKDLTVEPGIYISRRDEHGTIKDERVTGDITDPNFIKELKGHGIFLTKGEAISAIGGKLLQESESSRKALEDKLEEAMIEVEKQKDIVREQKAEITHIKRVNELNIKGMRAKDTTTIKELMKTVLNTVAAPVLLVVGRWLSNMLLPKLAMLL